MMSVETSPNVSDRLQLARIYGSADHNEAQGDHAGKLAARRQAKSAATKA